MLLSGCSRVNWRAGPRSEAGRQATSEGMRIRQRSGSEGQREAERLSLGRLFVRLGAMVVTLVLIDVFVAAYLRPGQHYDADWRLPRSWPMASLPGYANHIEGLPRDVGRPVVLFLGSSPTWGEMNRDRHHAYPAVFARVAHSAGSRARVYNLGTDGALVSDQYFIASAWPAPRICWPSNSPTTPSTRRRGSREPSASPSCRGSSVRLCRPRLQMC